MSALIDNLGNSFAVSANGTTYEAFPAQAMKYSWESLASDDSGRTLDGVMHIYWVKRNLKKIEITLPPCQEEIIYDLIPIIQGKEYYLQYYAPDEKSIKTIHCYTSSVGADMYSGVVMNGLWQNFTFSAIELGDE